MLLSVLLLLTVVGCSGDSQPSSMPEVDDPNAYLTDLFHGIYKLEDANSWYKDNVHPSTTGFNEITASLTPILQQKLG